MSNYNYNKVLKNFGKKLLRLPSKNILNRIASFRDIHKGQSCYIVGDGISLKYFDFKSLPKKTAIACNYSIFHKEITSLDLKYAVNYAPFFHKPSFGGYSKDQIESLKQTSKLTQKKIEEFEETNFFAHLTNFPFVNKKNCYYLLDSLPLSANDNIQEINTFKNVMEVSIVLAIYMGFKDINLLGFDYLHHPSVSHHWYEKGKGIVTNTQTKQKEFLKLIKKYVNITSITVDSDAQFMDFIHYQDFTGIKPIFRENVELTSREVLDKLAIHNDYNIY